MSIITQIRNPKRKKKLIFSRNCTPTQILIGSSRLQATWHFTPWDSFRNLLKTTENEKFL